MKTFLQQLGRIRLQLSNKTQVVGWGMTPDEAKSFFLSQKKTVVTLFGYSSSYEDENAMLERVRQIISRYSPETTLINIGGTRGGLGAAYPVAKSMGFTTTGIVTTLALNYPEEISHAVDYVCFIEDTQWGGKLPNSSELSATSQAMVACSDILIGIGGGEIACDEMLAGREQSKPIEFYPAEINHTWAIHRAKRLGLSEPDTFHGAAHAVFSSGEDAS